MSTTVRKEREVQERLVEVLGALLREEDNKYCVDCDCKGPRWASWTLGIFLCIRCAGIHRNLGVHISRVKSVNLDSWTPQQVAMMKEIGNSRGRAIFEANVDENFRRPQTDTTLEQFIRAKYEHKRYIAKEWIPPCPSADIIADEIRKLEQNNLQKKRLTANYGGSNSNITRRETTLPGKLQQEVDKSKAEKNDKVDLLGLDNIITDDSFGEFVFAPQTITSAIDNPPVISSAVDDLMGLSLGNNVVSTNNTFNNTVNKSSCSAQLSSLTAVSGPMDKSSILALYNNSSNIASIPQGSSQAWPGIGVPNHQTSMMAPQTDIYSIQQQQSQQYYGGSNWINSQQPPSQQMTGSFGTQHNPFFSTNTIPSQHQSTFTSGVSGQSTQQHNSLLW